MIAALKRHLTYLAVGTFPIMSLIKVTPALLMNLSLADVFVLLLGLVWLVDIRRFRLRNHFPYAWYFLLCIILLLVSNLYNLRTLVNDGGIGGMLSEIVKMAANAVFFFVAYNAVEREGDQKNKIFIAWLVGLYVFMGYGLYAQLGRFMGIPIWTFNRILGGRNRFLGTLTDANAAALYLSVSFFVVLIGKRYGTTSKRVWWLLSLTNILVAVCIGLTMSRGGIIGFLSGLAAWVVFNIKAYTRYIWTIPVALCLLLAVLAADTRFLYGNILRQFSSRVENIASESSMLQTRLNLSLTAVRIGVDHPVIGIGRGNFPLNSKPYLLEQGVDFKRNGGSYKDMVPHNTLAGVFAEMGLAGLAAFLSLFAILCVKITRIENLDRPFRVLLLSLWVSILVQSLAISLENARVFWVVTGLLMCIADNKITFKKAETFSRVSEPKRSETGASFKVGAVMASLLLCTMLYTYISLRYTNGTISLSNAPLVLEYQAEQTGRQTLRYWLSTVTGSGESNVMEVSIQRADTGEVISSITYPQKTIGYANLYFDANAQESFVIGFKSGKESSVNDVKIMHPDTGARVLASTYPLLPKSLYHYCQREGYLISCTADANSVKQRLRPGLLEEEYSIALGGKIRYNGVDIIQTDDGSTRFDFMFECLEEMDEVYSLRMRLVVDDINTLGKNQRTKKSINGMHKLDIPTDTWQAGVVYKQTYTIGLKEGQYALNFGFLAPADGSRSKIELSTPSGKAEVDAGWFNVE